MQYQKYNYISFFKKYFGANYILTKLIVVSTEPAVQRQRSPLKYHEVLVRNRLWYCDDTHDMYDDWRLLKLSKPFFY